MDPSLCMFILLSTLLIFPSSCSSQPVAVRPNRCVEDDRKVLHAIKQHFNKDPTEFSTWTPGTDCCKWAGVLCKKLPKTTINRVNFVEINNVVGTIPSDIGDLPYLENLFLRNSPNVTGTIPQSISKLTNLTIINFNGNNLTGVIPIFLSKLTKLSGLGLNNNHLTGPIPNFLGNLPNLSDLDLNNNQLIGTIPANLGLLPKLAFLSLSNNMLSGPIPKSFGNLDIAILELTGNKLTGDASFLFGENKTKLGQLSLGSNKLSFDLTNTVLPTGNMTTILFFVLDLSHNMIYGQVPEWIGEITSLWALDLSYNQLCGPIPPSIGARPDTFRASMFEHNKCLCDAPLAPCN